MLITIDDYYTIQEYNERIQALKNNKIEFKEYISTKAPFNFYIDIPSEPIMTNYDKMTNEMQKYLINKVQAVTPSEEYLLYRKPNIKNKDALKEYCLNTALKKADKSSYKCFFNIQNKKEGIELSEVLGDIYYFGRYYNKFKVALCTNPMIKNMIESDQILIDGTESILNMEQELNWKIFRLNDRLKKFTETPLFRNGKFIPVKIKTFNLNL